MDKKKFFSIILPVLSIAVFAYLLISSNQLDTFVAIIRDMKPLYIVLCILTVVLSWICEGYILQYVSDKSIKFTKALKITVAGLFFNAITPFASGGQPAQLYMLHREKVSLPKGGAMLTRKFIIFQTVLVIYSIFVVVFESKFFIDEVPDFIFIGFLGFIVNALVIGFLYVISYRYDYIKGILYKIGQFIRLKCKNGAKRKYIGFIRNIKEFHMQMHMGSSDGNIWLGFITFLQLTFYFSVSIFIYLGFGLTAPEFIHMISAAAFVAMVTSFIPLPGAAFGAEGSFYLFFGMFFPSNLVLSATIIWRILTFYFPLTVGLIIVMLESRNYAK